MRRVEAVSILLSSTSVKVIFLRYMRDLRAIMLTRRNPSLSVVLSSYISDT